MCHIKLVSPEYTYSKLQPGISNSQLIGKILNFNKLVMYSSTDAEI